MKVYVVFVFDDSDVDNEGVNSVWSDRRAAEYHADSLQNEYPHYCVVVNEWVVDGERM